MLGKDPILVKLKDLKPAIPAQTHRRQLKGAR
ncbi:hypothetical protein CbuK_0406 [Coxiella burnetii CbuK_Q154]|nr:hypothetical protein CbuK_0406 [Coxiella burnetii CbuK_Q154]